MTTTPRPSALVLGLCSHGLAVARALSARGVDVHAIEANRDLAGCRTRHATVHFVDDINGDGLIGNLVRVRDRIPSERAPVLFAINDRMVRILAERWDEIDAIYALGWSDTRETVRTLVWKDRLGDHCRRVGLAYPQHAIAESREGLRDALDQVPPPWILKPIRPLSRFKTRKATTVDGAMAIVDEFGSELPFLVQQWIDGDDRRLVICALYLDHGCPVAEFTGAKRRSSPPAMGATTSAVPTLDRGTLEAGKQFFRGLDLSGPVSVEFKRDGEGRHWVIEPTVGRTDFWLELAISNGIDLPWVEYLHATGQAIPAVAQSDRFVWMDTAKDKRALIEYLRSPDGARALRLPIRFPYLRLDDPGPFLSACFQDLAERFGRIL